MQSGEAYYYDLDGSRVPLRSADAVAVDLHAAEGAILPSDVLEGIKTSARELRAGLVMLEAKQVPQDVADALEAAGALQPVFGEEEDGFVVVLPEVRIEAADEEQAANVRRYLASDEIEHEIVRESGELLVVRPTSGRGADALSLANRVEEALHPPMAQARFLRIVRKRGEKATG